jgi:hypothetical protein
VGYKLVVPFEARSGIITTYSETQDDIKALLRTVSNQTTTARSHATGRINVQPGGPAKLASINE